MDFSAGCIPDGKGRWNKTWAMGLVVKIGDVIEGDIGFVQQDQLLQLSDFVNVKLLKG